MSDPRSKEKEPIRRGGSFDKAVNQVWDLLKSMRFALILLLIITAASIFNLFAVEFLVPTEADGSDALKIYTQAYGDLRTDILMFFKMYRPYLSWWYLLLLILLTFSLLVCVIERAPRVYRQTFKPRFMTDPNRYRGSQLYHSFNGNDTEKALSSVLHKHGFRVWTERRDGKTLIDGEKFSWARSGSWLVHIGFILLLIGGAVILRASYFTQVGGTPGEWLATDESRWGFNVRVDDFTIEYYPLDVGQWVMVDESQIGMILDQNKDGTFDVDIYKGDKGVISDVEPERIKNGFDYPVEGGRLDKGNISDYIAILTVVVNGKEVSTNRVEVNRPLRYNGYRFYQSSYNDQVRDEQGRWMTILAVRKDSGSVFIWAGIVLVTFGLVLGLYFTPVRIYGLIQEVDGREVVHLAGMSKKNPALFKSRFNLISKEIKQVIHPKEDQ